VQVQMVRILQEALNNIRKHAYASRVSITLREWGGDLVMEIHDDGRGFDPEDVPEMAQYGLRGMRERAEMIGAELQIISAPHLGTTVQVSLPSRQEENVE
jgi:two-component system nitrate/nitrite sensor histidine kinase NarX